MAPLTGAQAISFDLHGTLLDGSPLREVVIRPCEETGAEFGVQGGRLAEANREVWGQVVSQGGH